MDSSNIKNHSSHLQQYDLGNLSSERSTQLEDGTINSIDKNYDVSPLLMSSCRSEKWTPVNTCDYDSPLSLKKEPKSRLKTIGRNLVQFKKNYSSMDTKVNVVPISDNFMEGIPGMLKILEKYEILEVLGKGSQGIVYKVQHKITRETYAAKKILFSDSETFHNIENEIKILKEVQHENIIKFHEAIKDEENKCIFCLFEYFPSKNLYEILKSNQIFTQHYIKFIISKVLEALAYLHKKDICHRDLTLSNILLSNDFKIVKIIDFGVAKQVNLSANFMMSPVGKWNNLPPEYEMEGCYTTKYDIWLVGLILLEMLYRTQIYSKKAIQIVKNIKEKDNSYEEKLILEEECKELIFQLLEKNPDNRISAQKAVSHIWLTKSQII